MRCRCFFLIVLCTASVLHAQPAQVVQTDVCIYGATPAGILAAVAVKRAGCDAVIVEPSRWVGGMLGAGLKPMQDCPNPAATGGMTRHWIQSLGQDAPSITSYGRSGLNPAAIRQDFQTRIEANQIEIFFDHRIASCEKQGSSIEVAIFDRAPFDELGCPVAAAEQTGSLMVHAKVFIDAGYDGDLMPAAGVSYRIGRESSDEFNELHAGVQPPMELTPISPFVRRDEPSSGLLDLVEQDHGYAVGSADHYTQAYNYRYITTSDPEFRLPIDAPDDYDPARFELVGRYVAYLVNQSRDDQSLRKQLIGICPGWMNSGEWNYQRNSLFSQSPLGISQIYADGDYVAKAEVWKTHQNYLGGLFQFMRSDERVPSWFRDEIAELGLDRRPHPETSGWPHQLYIRVARRLRGPYTITAHDVYNTTTVDDPIGLAQYGIDTYPARRIWIQDGQEVKVGIEGKMFIGGSRGPTNVPYPISYRAITPLEHECGNLLVPVCFSASHLGYASARMEPVFMICGESAGIAAVQAIKQNVAVQNIDQLQYQETLRNAGQKLSWDPQVDVVGSSSERLDFNRLIRELAADDDRLVTPDEWNAGKKSHQWLFPVIDTNQDGKIDEREYAAFQQYKTDNPTWSSLDPRTAANTSERIRAFPAPEAHQAAAANGGFFYAITNQAVAKYSRATGQRVAISDGEAKHLNSGFFWQGRMYCAHSNYPAKPEQSQVMVLDVDSMKLTVEKDFGDFGGSLTWVVRHQGDWWCNFAYYGDENARTTLIQFDDAWQQRRRWTYPAALISQLGKYSLSGGIWYKDSLLVTGHDDKVLFQLRLPKQGDVLQLIDQIDIPFTGQGIAIDPITGGLVGIDRAAKQLLFVNAIPQSDAQAVSDQ